MIISGKADSQQQQATKLRRTQNCFLWENIFMKTEQMETNGNFDSWHSEHARVSRELGWAILVQSCVRWKIDWVGHLISNKELCKTMASFAFMSLKITGIHENCTIKRNSTTCANLGEYTATYDHPLWRWWMRCQAEDEHQLKSSTSAPIRGSGASLFRVMLTSEPVSCIVSLSVLLARLLLPFFCALVSLFILWKSQPKTQLSSTLWILRTATPLHSPRAATQFELYRSPWLATRGVLRCEFDVSRAQLEVLIPTGHGLRDLL